MLERTSDEAQRRRIQKLLDEELQKDAGDGPAQKNQA